MFVVCPLVLFGAAGCMDDIVDDESTQTVAQADNAAGAPAIDIRRSLAVIDLPTLAATDEYGNPRFSLQRVLNQIMVTSGAAMGGGAKELYRRLFDVNNTKLLGAFTDGQHCDDTKDADGNPVLNGFPIQCPRQEGVLTDMTTHDPFCSGAGTCDPYSPIAIVNRFDLAPPDGRTCGQYRIVFGKGTGGETPVATAGNHLPFDRNLIIFEAVLPNPQPYHGLAGCAPVMEHWAGLSALDTPAKRAKALDRFFFKGITGFEPAIKFSHYIGTSVPQTGVLLSGQIRTNQFMFNVGQQAWQLRELNLERACPGNYKPCVAKVKLVTTKLNPSASLFDENNISATAQAFRNPLTQRGFFSQIGALASDDINRINMDVLGPQFNTAQSTSSPNFNVPQLDDSNYNIFFDPAGPFAANIQTKLTALGSPLTPTQIVRRAQTQACAGCHELATTTGPFFGGAPDGNQLGGGLVWPDVAKGSPTIGFLQAFSQTSEVNLQPIDPASGVLCDTACTANPLTCKCEWVISPAMTDVFLPARKANMVAFLASHPNGHHGCDD
jgi:hypothetical protein